MRRRTDQADARRGMARPRNPRVHLVTRQLAALAGFGSLRHLDLQVVGIDQVLRCHAEASRGHLVDRRATQIAIRIAHVPIGVFAAFAGVRLPANAIHRDGQGLVRFFRDRAIRHRTGRETLQDFAQRLNFVDGNRWTHTFAEREQAPQRRQPSRLIVDELGVLLEDVVTLGARGVLELEYRLRIEEVVLTFAPPLILTTEVQVAVRAFDGPVGVGDAEASGDLLGDLVQTNAVEARDSAGEVLVDQLLRQANRLENL